MHQDNQYSTSDSNVLAPWIGGPKTTDEWIAFEPVRSNSMNTDWIQIGSRSHGTDLCEFVSGLGYLNYNSWGCQPYTGYIVLESSSEYLFLYEVRDTIFLFVFVSLAHHVSIYGVASR